MTVGVSEIFGHALTKVGRAWEGLGGLGRACESLGGLGRAWESLGGLRALGRTWEDLGGLGRAWEGYGGFGSMFGQVVPPYWWLRPLDLVFILSSIDIVFVNGICGDP